MEFNQWSKGLHSLICGLKGLRSFTSDLKGLRSLSGDLKGLRSLIGGLYAVVKIGQNTGIKIKYPAGFSLETIYILVIQT